MDSRKSWVLQTTRTDNATRRYQVNGKGAGAAEHRHRFSDAWKPSRCRKILLQTTRAGCHEETTCNGIPIPPGPACSDLIHERMMEEEDLYTNQLEFDLANSRRSSSVASARIVLVFQSRSKAPTRLTHLCKIPKACFLEFSLLFQCLKLLVGQHCSKTTVFVAWWITESHPQCEIYFHKCKWTFHTIFRMKPQYNNLSETGLSCCTNKHGLNGFHTDITCGSVYTEAVTWVIDR